MQHSFALTPYSVHSRLLIGAAYGALATANALERGNRGVVRHADLRYGNAPRQRLDVYVPTGRRTRATRGVVVFLHGGFWTYFGRRDFVFVGHALAERGLVTVVPDYRRSPRVGVDAQLHDAALAVRWTLRHARGYGGAQGGVTLVGHSSGAHLAALLALDRSRLERVGVPQSAVRGFVGLSGPYDFAPTANASMARFFGPPERYAAASPVNFAFRHSPPALLIHGLRDGLVLPQNSAELARRLRVAGVPVVLHMVGGDRHGSALARWIRTRRRDDAVLAAIARFAGARGAAIMPLPPTEVPMPCTPRAPEPSPSSS